MFVQKTAILFDFCYPLLIMAPQIFDIVTIQAHNMCLDPWLENGSD